MLECNLFSRNQWLQVKAGFLHGRLPSMQCRLASKSTVAVTAAQEIHMAPLEISTDIVARPRVLLLLKAEELVGAALLSTTDGRSLHDAAKHTRAITGVYLQLSW